MKVLFAIDTLGSGGKERRLTELLKALKITNDIESQLAVMSEDIHYNEVIELGIRIHKIIRKTKKDLSVFGRFYKLIRSYRPDIVHCWDSMTAFYLAPVCKMLHCTLINGMVIDAPLRQNIFNKHWLRARLTFPFSDVIVCNSNAGLAAYNAPVKKSVVIYNGFNFARTEGLASMKSIRDQLSIKTALIVGMVATFWKNKDYPSYFKAAGLILEKQQDITFVAIGANTDSPESMSLIEEKYINNFRLLGKQNGVESYINAMDICVLSTFTEGISNAVLEYMALGKPVIVTRGGGTCEIVSDGISGFLVDPLDPDALAGKIEILLSDPKLRTEMGSAGQERIREEFSIDQMVKKYTELYNRLSLKY